MAEDPGPNLDEILGLLNDRGRSGSEPVEPQPSHVRALKGRLRSAGGVVVTWAVGPVVRRAAFTGRKQISAMMRVKNEEEFLRASVLSIIEVIDEVVIIDNRSSDGTAGIIAELARQFPDKVRTRTYDHSVARYGQENRELASTFRGRRSPRLLANFYNWCMAQCTHQFILKWDGDTVATDLFRQRLESFKDSPKQALWVTGVNLHPTGRHLIRLIPTEPIEPRVVNRRFAKYTNHMGYCEGIVSPYIRRFVEYSEYVDEPSYIHMKYCKRSRYQQMSEDLQQLVVEFSADEIGQPVSDDILEQVRAYNLAPVEP